MNPKTQIDADALLGALALELRKLRAQMTDLCESQEHLVRRVLKVDDRRTGAALLPLLEEKLGVDVAFTSEDLFADALNDRTPLGQALLELMTDPGEEDAGARAFGKLLVRLEDVPFAGLRLVAVGATRNPRKWRLVRVSKAGNPLS